MSINKYISVAPLMVAFLTILCCEEIFETHTGFKKTYGFADYAEKGHDVQQTSDGGFIMVGSTRYGYGEEDVYLVKTNPEGIQEWHSSFGGSKSDVGYSVRQTSDSGYVVVGNRDEDGIGGSDVWLFKTNSEGIRLWNRTFAGSEKDIGYAVQITSDGGYIVVGVSDSFGSGEGDVWLIKTDSRGVEEWNVTLGGEEYDRGHDVKQTSDGGYIITGYTWSSISEVSDILLIKTDSQGNEEWSRHYGGENYDTAYEVDETSDGGFIIVGFTNSFEANNFDVWLIKTSPEGDEEWNRTFGGSGSERGRSVEQTSDGGFIFTGYTSSFGSGGNDLWLVKTNSQGTKKWSKTFGGTLRDDGYSVEQTSDGGFIITGTTNSFGSGSDDFWLIKTDEDGNI